MIKKKLKIDEDVEEGEEIEETEEQEEPKVQKSKKKYDLVEVPTQTTIVFKNNDTEELMDLNQAVLRILNTMDKIEKAVA